MFARPAGRQQRRKTRRRGGARGRNRRRRRIIVVVSVVVGVLAVGGGSVVSGLVVRYKRRFARGADWLARSEAWWNRRRQTWLAAVSRAPLGRAESPPSDDVQQQ